MTTGQDVELMLKPHIRSAIVDFLLEEDGPTAVEYAVMLALILIACAGSVSILANQTKESFDASGDAISGAFGN